MPRMAPNAERVNRMLMRHHAWLIVGVRFMYGVRIVGPMVIGMSDVSARRFLFFNLIGAAIWAVVISGAGYMFGHTLKWLLADVERYEVIALVVIITLAALAAMAHHWLSRRKSPPRR